MRLVQNRNSNAIDRAEFEHLTIVQFLHDNRADECTAPPRPFILAFLHETGCAQITKETFENTIRLNRLGVIQ